MLFLYRLWLNFSGTYILELLKLREEGKMRMQNRIRKIIVMLMVVGILVNTLRSSVRANSDIAVSSERWLAEIK